MKLSLTALYLVFLTGLICFMSGCTSLPQRSKWTDPSFRIAIDPISLASNDYVRVQRALVQSGKYFVVDRGKGFNAVVKEQDMEHGYRNAHALKFDRFNDRERYARIAKLYGVGAIVIGHSQCGKRYGFWGAYGVCVQNLAIVNANTGEVVAAVEGNMDAVVNYNGDIQIAPAWDETVEKLNNAIPKNYAFEKYDERMELYKDELKEDSQREREGVNWQ